ncbi:MAG: hypothetical protein JWR51_956 [Devosia sp.]|uniref:GIN domain-containing protein n=1 Tax=Devosia sp. TaxID=1871048 RepID=UPI002619363A|nr:DUF2807 domain-containing protein [Devosia sp.]MDB5527853.1 hypothetical protein [Devosia sp.]
MRQILRLALAGSIVLTMVGSAMAESRDFDLTGFTKLDIHTGINATVTLGDAFSVHAESANKDLLDKLEVTLEGDTLSASVDQNFLDFIFNGGVVGQLLGANNLTLTITLPTLTAVSASSAADVDVTGAKGDLDINASSGADLSIAGAALGAVRVDASSGSDVSLSGTCTSLTAQTSTGSDLKAADLKCASAAVDASSGGDVSVFASASIKANASSGADITVAGKPAEQAVDSSSGGDITIED